jgi:3-dehydroquinate dehydratase type I
MLLVATILEGGPGEAIAAIARTGDCDAIEVRVEQWPAVDYAALRSATDRPLILTWRNRGPEPALAALDAAAEAGIDLVDVEWREGIDPERVSRHRSRIVLSHHDYEGMDDVEAIFGRMRAFGCAQTKLAATPQTFAQNLHLLRLLDGSAGLTVIGMGERGLYARILAPFRGSALAFVAAGTTAAPGQLSLERALAIYGTDRADLHADAVFAVAGNPAGHSESPVIHNGLFREKGVHAAYTVASFDRFGDVARGLLHGELAGLSITAPFKEEALAFAREQNAVIGADAEDAGSVNTLVNIRGRLLADNTDVDGFRRLLSGVCGRDRKSVAILGAGGTARAALTAVRREGMPSAIFNRTPGRLDAQPMTGLARWDGEVIIDTTSADLEIPLRPGMTYIRAAYGSPSRALESAAAQGVQRFDGLDLLEAQAIRQHELFMRVFDGL